MRTVGAPTTRLTFGSHLRARRVGEAEFNNALYPNHVMKYIHTVHRHTSAVTNVAVTPAAEPCNVIAARKYIGGSDSECAIRLLLTLIFACRRGGKETFRRGLKGIHYVKTYFIYLSTQFDEL